MKKVHNVKKICFANGKMKLIVDGEEYIVSLNQVSRRLSKASIQEKEKYEISASGYGIHWPLVDEDLSIDALINIFRKG